MKYLQRLTVTFVTIWFFVAVFGSSGCVTSGDLHRIADSQAIFEARAEETLEKLEAGQSTAEEARKEIRTAAEDARSVAEEVIADVAKRTEDGVGGLIDGLTNPAGAAQAGVAAVLLNLWRDRKRKKRGEATV